MTEPAPENVRQFKPQKPESFTYQGWTVYPVLNSNRKGYSWRISYTLTTAAGTRRKVQVADEEGFREDARYNDERGMTTYRERFATAAEVVGALARALYKIESQEQEEGGARE